MARRYVEIREEILARIWQGEWSHESLLPSENQLAKEYGVTRATVRQALAALEQDRVLTTRQGVGRYVNPRSRIVSVLTKLESTDKMMAVSYTGVRKQLVEFKDIALSADEAKHLELVGGAPAVRMVRIRFASSQRAAVSVNIFPKACAPAKPVDGSLLDTMDQLGYRVDYAQTEIIIPAPTDLYLRHLQDPEQEDGHTPPIVILKQVHFDNMHRPVFLSFDYLNMNVFSLQVTRQR